MALEKAILEAQRKSENKSRTCMFDSCMQTAIKSHVLQKNGILREISKNNHLIELVPSNPFEMEEKGISDFKLVGINNVYTFSGFCQAHDSEIFKLIETNSSLNFNIASHQALFCYRGLCQEIRRKEIATEWTGDIREYFPDELKDLLDTLLEGYLEGIKNLTFFKRELENCIKVNNYDLFQFKTLEIPRIELCISAPLNIGELVIPEDLDYEKWKKNQPMPFITSFMNVFPKGLHSYIICGYHKKYPCEWTDEFIKKIKNGTSQSILKEISDLITLRLEFWAMSPSLFKQIDKRDLERYKNLFMENVLEHSPDLNTELNLFKFYNI